LLALPMSGVSSAADAAIESGPAAVAIKSPDIDEHGYLKLGFEQLAGFTFVPPQFDPTADPKIAPPTGEEQIPAVVKSWSGRKAVIVGYMLPVKMEKGLVTEFLLMRNTQSCCYGAVPNLNEWIVVKMKKGVQPMMDVPVAFYGEFKVGTIFENGYISGLYQLAGERMVPVQE
jgi:hypothetical protein